MSDLKPVEAPAHAAPELPVSLPPRLIGREGALAQVYNQLKEGRPVHLYGARGSGKTALAATLANAYSQQPGGALWLHVDDPRLDDLIVRVGRAYNEPDIANSPTPVGMIGAVATTLQQHKPLIVLDGSISADVASRFVSRCADGLPVMVITEERIEGPWAAMEVAALEPAGALALFKQEGRVHDASADAAIAPLVAALDHQPFAVVIAARAMVVSKAQPAQYAEVLEKVRASTGGSPATTALTASTRALTGAYQGVLLMLGATFTGTATAELLSMISGAAQPAVEQALNVLAQLNLCGRFRRRETMFYQLHPLTHAFIQQWLQDSDRLKDLQEKVLDATLNYARQYSDSAPDSYDKLALEMDSLLAAAQWSVDQGRSDTANALIVALTEADGFINERGYRHEFLRLREMATRTGQEMAFPAYDEEVYDTDDDFDEDDLDEDGLSPEDLMSADAFDLDEDEEFDDDDLDDDDLDDVDDLDDENDDFDFDEVQGFEDEEVSPLSDRLLSGIADEIEAEDFSEQVDATPRPAAAPAINLQTASLPELRAALVQVRQAGDFQQEIAIQHRIGKEQVAAGMENEAMSTYGELLTIYESIADEAGTLETLDMLSALAARTGNAQAALMHAARGVRLAETLDETITHMQLLITQGDAHQQLGESDDARKTYLQALEIARNSDDSQNEAIILYKLGNAQLDDGDTDVAIETLEQALSLFKSQGKRRYEGRVLGALGTTYGELERWGEAVNFHTSALYIAREVGDRPEETNQLTSLGYANEAAGNLGDALLRYRQALHLAFVSEANDAIVSALVDLSRLLLMSKRHLKIAELLINRAAGIAPNDKDVVDIQQRIAQALLTAQAEGVEMLPVKGSAEDYASNAYAMLDT